MLPEMGGESVRKVLVAAVLVLAATATLRGEPLDPGRVPAGAKWLAHIDFDALRKASLAQKVYDSWISQNPQKHRFQLEQFQKAFGVDPINDIHDVTIHGTVFAEGSGVAVVRAGGDPKRLLRLLSFAADYQTDEYGKHTLHRWTENKGKPNEHTTTGCFHGPADAPHTVAVVGRRADEVKAALDVLDGKSPSLDSPEAGDTSPLKQDVPPGTVLVARAVELAKAPLPLKSPFMRKTEQLALAAGQYDGEVFVQAKLVAGEPEVADQVQAAIEGLRAVVLLQRSENENLVEVLQAVKVDTAEATVSVEWRMTVDKLLKLLEEEWEKRRKVKQEQTKAEAAD